MEEYKKTQDIIKKFAPLFEELGKISMFFSNIEFITTEMLVYLINEGNPFVGFTIINEYPIYKKIDLLKELFIKNSVSNEIKNDFLNICNELDQIRVKRNNFIHGLWILSMKDYPKIRQVSIRFKKNKKESSFEREELEIAIEEISDISIKSQAISNDLFLLYKRFLNNLNTNKTMPI